MSEPLRVALVGCGAWGKNLLRVLIENNDVNVVCVIDTNPRALAAAHDSFPSLCLRDSTAALHQVGAQAVVVATPGPMHAQHALEAIDCGAHVFIEKPMATSLADAARIAESADRRGVVGMVGHLLRYHPAVQAMIALVHSGELGAPLRLSTRRCSLAGSRDVDGSVLWSLAPHDLSILRALDPSRLLTLRADSRRGGRIATLDLRTAAGLDATLMVSRASDRKIRTTLIECERGRVEFDDVAATDKVRVWRNNSEPSETLAYAQSEPLRGEIATFVRCVRHHEQPPSDVAEGLAVVSILAQAGGIIESALSRPPLFAER